MAQPIILLLAIVYTLYFASEFAIPVSVAIVLTLAFSPLTRKLARHGVPRPVSAIVIVVSLSAVLCVGLWRLSDSALEWLARSPTIISQIEYKLREIKEPVEQVKEASKKVQEMAEVGASTSAQQDVVVKPPSLFENLFGTMRTALVQTAVTLVLLLLLLSSGNLFKLKLVSILPGAPSKQRSLAIWRKIEWDISAYISTVSLINLTFGSVVAGAMYLTGMPNAILWGTMAGLLNFLPYIGALAGLTIVTMISIITFDSLSHALLIPAIYGALNILEAQFLTPVILGNRLSLNFVVVFVSVIFWGWLWGVAGAALAVPFLIIAKTICDNSLTLRPVAKFMAISH